MASDRIELGFGASQYVGVAVAGLFGMVPVTTWLMTVLAQPLGLLDDARTREWPALANDALAALVVLLILVAPWLVPCLVLRARQPRGARIEWDEERVVEWDGPWKRSAIAWTDMRAAALERALQLTSTSGGDVITVWDGEPDDAPTVRRRLCGARGSVDALRRAMDRHHVRLDGHLDWSKVVDADRPRPAWQVWIGRLGYPCSVIGPLVAGPSRAWGFAIALFGAAFLTIRALPVLHEIRAKLMRPGTPSPAERLLHRAVAIEAVIRASFVLLTIASTISSAYLIPFDSR